MRKYYINKSNLLFSKCYNLLTYWTCSICCLNIPYKYKKYHIKSRDHIKQEFIKTRILETIIE